jgi:transcriptional regulator with GAF, ATPase, and Fis domain
LPLVVSAGWIGSGEDAERERILDALRFFGGNVSGTAGAATRLGLRRATLQCRKNKPNIEQQ